MPTRTRSDPVFDSPYLSDDLTLPVRRGVGVSVINSFFRRPAFPWTASALGALAATFTVPLLIELPIYFSEASHLAAGNLLPTTHPLSWPIGYSLILSPFVFFAGINGIVAIQVAAYAVTCWLFWKLLIDVAAANRRRVSPIVLGLGVALVAFHPYLLLDIKRINESAFTPLLTLVVCRWMLVEEVSHRFRDAVLLGMSLGLYVLMRPNAVTIALLPLMAAFISRSEKPAFYWLAIYLVALFGLYVAASLLATGQMFYWPSNGPYNLAAGNNPFAMSELLHHQNGEPSLPAALAAAGMPGVEPYSIAPDMYSRLAMNYAIDHPVQFLELIGIKIIVLFSPRLFNADTTFKVITQSLLLYPVVAYLIAFVGRIKTGTFTRPDWLMLGMVILFTVPFAVTNADPRLRMPLDLAMLAMAFVWLDEKFSRSPRNL